MKKSLRFLSISYKNASVSQREAYHVSEENKKDLVKQICNGFDDVAGVLLLVTCNRTEVYFESTTTSANVLGDFIIDLKSPNNTNTDKQFFQFGNTTKEAVLQLLNVASGLESSVIGDAEIINQIKKAYQLSIALKLQGSLLERAMQTVFKSHKRISNETSFRDGTTSTAYKALKAINETYGIEAAKAKKILFIGAGDIVKQLFKYNSKFKFNNIYISNRTENKAVQLADKNNLSVLKWSKVLNNEFHDFDVIISAASNCPNLVHILPFSPKNILLIDLAIPANINNALANRENVNFYNLDSISKEFAITKERRIAAINKVTKIINEEYNNFQKWLEEAPLREVLAQHRIKIQQEVEDYFMAKKEFELISPKNLKVMVDQIMRRAIIKFEKLPASETINSALADQISLLKKLSN
jgi:glutamyl-tRNA reductase